MSLEHYRQSSERTQFITESVIREMTRLAVQHKAVNVGQGVPDFPCPPKMKEAASEALYKDINQYAITWGDKLLREAIASKYSPCLGFEIDPEKDITVTCGSTEAMIVTMLALVNPGEEVIVLDPFYENYVPQAILAGVIPRHVTLHPPEWIFDFDELEAAFSNKTKAIIINSPHNPTGKVFTREELIAIARLCQKWGVIAITDEIYEHILYDGAEHISMASLPGMQELTVTINSISKTYSLTGWRVGWAIANADLTNSIRKVHDFMTIGSPAPLQRAAVAALSLPRSFYEELAKEYLKRRNYMLETLDMAGFSYFKPQGAYYVFSNVDKFGFPNDLAFSKHLLTNVGVAVIPSSSFFQSTEKPNSFIRFCFSRKQSTLEQVREKLCNGQLRNR